MKPATKPGAFLRNPNVRIAMAWLLPFAVCLLQWTFWRHISPFSWFLFYPVAFFAPFIGGLRGGIGATLISALLVWYFFLPPQFSVATGRTWQPDLNSLLYCERHRLQLLPSAPERPRTKVPHAL